MSQQKSGERVILKGGKRGARTRAETALRQAGFCVANGPDAVALGRGGKTSDLIVDLTPQPLAPGAQTEVSPVANLEFSGGGAPDLRLFAADIGGAVGATGRKQLGAFLLVNLDHFKRVRAMLGVQTADDLLREVSARLKAALIDHDRRSPARRPGRLLHMGGDEFALLLPDLKDGAEASRFAEELLQRISGAYETIAPQVYLTGRVGIAVWPRDGRTIEDLARNAGLMVHQDAPNGRNTVRPYSAGKMALAAARFELESELSRAIFKGELEVHYQPQFSLKNGRIIGAEALVRWRRPGQEVIPAEVFIALAEDLGLIADIGTWVLTTAARECQHWQRIGLGRLRVAINTSAYQFSRLDMLEVVDQALRDTGLDPSCLMLEVTESLVLSDVGRTVKTLTDLRDMGVRIALDDFGKGYSSMSYLKSFTLDSLKLDRAFVEGLPASRGDVAMAEAIIRMAKALDLEVTAEGVENEAQRACLARMGCDYYQGYLASRAVPARDFTELLEAAAS